MFLQCKIGAQNLMKERYLSKTPNATSKCNIKLPGIFGNSKKRFLWTGLLYSFIGFWAKSETEWMVDWVTGYPLDCYDTRASAMLIVLCSELGPLVWIGSDKNKEHLWQDWPFYNWIWLLARWQSFQSGFGVDKPARLSFSCSLDLLLMSDWLS